MPTKYGHPCGRLPPSDAGTDGQWNWLSHATVRLASGPFCPSAIDGPPPSSHSKPVHLSSLRTARQDYVPAQPVHLNSNEWVWAKPLAASPCVPMAFCLAPATRSGCADTLCSRSLQQSRSSPLHSKRIGSGGTVWLCGYSMLTIASTSRSPLYSKRIGSGGTFWQCGYSVLTIASTEQISATQQADRFWDPGGLLSEVCRGSSDGSKAAEAWS
jgi:hypothetical protein